MLVVRLTRNHPLPDGNKRAAWVSLRLFVDINDWSWDPKPTVDQAEAAVLAVTAGGWDEAATAAWLGHRLRPLRPDHLSSAELSGCARSKTSFGVEPAGPRGQTGDRPRLLVALPISTSV